MTVDLTSKRAAFATIRKHRPQGVLVPLGECDCAYEVPVVSGIGLLLTSGSNPAPFLQGERARQFVHDAELVLSALHQLGIRHGDPGYQNFLMAETGVCLIDLDDLDLGSRIWARWELVAFFRDTVVPVLGRKGTLYVLLDYGLVRGYLFAVAAGGLSHLFRRGRSAMRIVAQVAIPFIRRKIAERTISHE